MEIFNCLLIVMIIIVVPFVSTQDATTHCFKESQTSAKVKIQCPEGFTIAIQDILYGSNSYKECSYTTNTCVDRPRDLNKSQCLGQQNCSLTARRMYSVDCGGYVDFFRVIFECFPVFVARNYTFPTQPATPNVPKYFGRITPVRDTTDDESSGTSVGMILAIVGCVLGTLYISVVCIILALLFRRSETKKELSTDEEQPAELDNSAFKGSNQGLQKSGEKHSQYTQQTTETRDSNRNIVASRQGPDGKEIDAQLVHETETPTTRTTRDKSHYNSNIQHGGNIAPKNLFTRKENKKQHQPRVTISPDVNTTQITEEDPTHDVSSC